MDFLSTSKGVLHHGWHINNACAHGFVGVGQGCASGKCKLVFLLMKKCYTVVVFEGKKPRAGLCVQKKGKDLMPDVFAFGFWATSALISPHLWVVVGHPESERCLPPTSILERKSRTSAESWAGDAEGLCGGEESQG
jgi:hypothetical protein